MRILGFRILWNDVWVTTQQVLEEHREKLSAAQKELKSEAKKIYHLTMQVRHVDREAWFHTGTGFPAAKKGHPYLDRQDIISFYETRTGGECQRYEIEVTLRLRKEPSELRKIHDIGYVNWRGLNWKATGFSTGRIEERREYELQLVALADPHDVSYRREITNV